MCFRIGIREVRRIADANLAMIYIYCRISHNGFVIPGYDRDVR
jgi:hypothetical protein